MLAAAYVAAVAWMRRSPVSRAAGGQVVPVPTGWSRPSLGELRPVVLRYLLAAAVIFAAAPFLARSAEEIAEGTGLGQTFVGASLVGITTSLPELVSSVAAVRIGAYDLAVGNLFGSSAFNMFLLLRVDAAYRAGPLLPAMDPSQTVAGVGTILLMPIALAALVHGTETRARRLEPDAVFLLIAYAGALFAVWSARP